MHAFLILGSNPDALNEQLEKLAKKLKAKQMEFPLAKIEDVRALGSFTNLKVTFPTAIVVRDLGKATVAAQNAFLKNLEEPQKDLYYLITATNVKSVLPTIASRCQIVRGVSEDKPVSLRKVVEFLKMRQEERLGAIDRIRKREEAIVFTENLLKGCHKLLHLTKDKHLILAKAAKSAALARARLKANGNVTIQLTNMVIGLV